MNSLKALVVFSGGQDSTTCLVWALNRYSEVEAITFLYNQVYQDVELKQSKKICKKLKIKQKVVKLSFQGLTKTSSLLNPKIKINKKNAIIDGRNILLFTYSAIYSKKIGAKHLVTGIRDAGDQSHTYPDCRKSFITSLERSLGLGLDYNNLRIKNPLMNLKKEDIFELAERESCLDLVLKNSYSCYEANNYKENEWGYGCGKCPACTSRKRGWKRYKKKRSLQ